MASDLADIQDCVSNRLPKEAEEVSWLAGIVGDRPSQYAKSPAIWNPTFRKFQMDAFYVPFDVEEARLPSLLEALKAHPRLLGFNVTVPHKMRVIPLLDDLEPKARRIGAVNAVVREEDGRLAGYNTDGQGGIDSLTRVQPGAPEAFVPNLHGAKTLLIGAGGAAAALAHYLAEEAEGGTLFIANRTEPTAESLAASVREAGGHAEALGEKDIAQLAPDVDLIVNATVKGQAGVRQLSGGQATCLEPYSSLAPANPASLPGPAQGKENEFYAAWWDRSWRDVCENQRISSQLDARVPAHVCFFDAIYAPQETVFLRHGRLSGHRTLNGKGMNVCQAADGFFNRVMASYLRKQGLFNSATYAAIRDFMYEVW
ncbi:MAG: shikimate dehydrogenase family protein [Nitrospinota bacterium]